MGRLIELSVTLFGNIGFDGHLDTPVENVHVVLLGVLKYLYCEMVLSLSESQKIELLGRWSSFSTEGLNCPPAKPPKASGRATV